MNNMARFVFRLFFSSLLMTIAACSIPGTKTFHAESHVVDNYRVVNFMNQRAGRIGIQLRDQYDEPFYMTGVKRIKAEVTVDGAVHESVWLRPEDLYSSYDEESGTVLVDDTTNFASTYSYPFDWISHTHTAQLRVWIPQENGGTRELSFQCNARSGLDEPMAAD